MLLDNLEFHAMQNSLDALWMKQKVISNNLANQETPGFKAQKVTFQDVLADTRSRPSAGEFGFRAVVTKDLTTTVRPDGNNVNVDNENLELFNTYMQMTTLYQKVSGQINDVRYVLTNAFK